MKTSLKQNHLSKKWTCHILTKPFLTCLLLLLGQISIAQNTSDDHQRFSVDYIRGCAPLTVNLTDLAIETGGAAVLVHFNRDPNDRISTDGFENGAMAVGGQIDTTYSTPGTYLIGQLNANAPNGAQFDFITIVVTESAQPVFTLAACTDNNVFIDIDFSSDQYDGYLIDYGDGNSQPITKNDPSNLTYAYASQGDYTITVSGQLSNGFIASCGVSTDAITTILDLPLPSITQLDVQTLTAALLTYTGLEDNITYQAEATDPNGVVFSEALTLIDNPSNFLFENAAFDFQNTIYNFRIIAMETCGNSTGFSNQIASVTLNYDAIYNGDEIDITFDWMTSPTDLTELILFRDNVEISRSPDALGQETITIENCAGAPPVRIEADFNGVTSTSQVLIPDLVGTLTPQALDTPELLFSGGDILVRWTATSIPNAQYIIYKQDADSSFIEIGTTDGTQFVDSNLNGSANQVCYRVSYRDQCTNESILSEIVCGILSNKVLIPNAFMPESMDPANKTFKVVDGVYRNFEFYIYNRWGVLLFSTTDSSVGWDGMSKGQQSPAGSYVYRLKYFDINDIMTSVSDSFLLIR